MNDVDIISLYHLCRYVFSWMLTWHDWARPQFSNLYLPLLKLCTDPLHGRDIDLTVIFKSGRILSSSFRCVILYLSIPIPCIMPNRLTGASYLALGNYAVHVYLIYLTHVPYINDGCSSHSIYYCSCTPGFVASRSATYLGFVAPSSLHSQLYHT